jgi:hypothetical protein
MINPLVPISSDQRLFMLKYIFCFTKQAILTRR